MDLELLLQIVPFPIVAVGGYFALVASASSLPMSNDGKRLNWGGWWAGLAIIATASILYAIIVWFLSAFAGTTGDPTSITSFRKFMFFDLGIPYWLAAAVSPFVIAWLFQKESPQFLGIQGKKTRMFALFLVIAIPGLFFLYFAIDSMMAVKDQLEQWKR